MADKQDKANRPKRSQRHPIVLYQALNEQVFWPSILILAVSIGLFVWNPPELEPYRPHLLVIFVGTGLLLILTFLFRLRAYARCDSDALEVQLPFFSLTVPYRDIKASRTAQFARVFPPDEQRWTQRRFLRWLWGHTLVVVEMERLPRPRTWLKLRMGPYLLHPLEESLTLPVRDWITFRSDLDEALAHYRRGTSRT